MRKAFSVPQAQALDRLAIEKYGIPSIVLMENAGRAATQEVLKILKSRKRKAVCVFCGSGNNGGDGFVAARHLLNAGIKIKIFLVGKPQELKQDPAIFYHILKRLKCPLKSIRKMSVEVFKDLEKADMIVDAIFGIGLSRRIGEPFRSMIEAVNRAKKFVVALDVPSGLDATTGKIFGVCVKADLTVTFAVMKKGLLKNDGPHYSGKVIVADIGIPKILEKAVSCKP